MSKRDFAASPSSISLGWDWFDSLFEGGFVPGTLTYLYGNPGAGRGTLAAQFLMEGAVRNQKGLWVSLDNVMPVLPAGMQEEWQSLCEEGRIDWKVLDPLESSGKPFLSRLEQCLSGRRYTRVVISPVEVLSAVETERAYVQLVRRIRKEKLTTLMIGTLTKFGPSIEIAPAILASLSDCILLSQVRLESPNHEIGMTVLKSPSRRGETTTVRLMRTEDGLEPGGGDPQEPIAYPLTPSGKKVRSLIVMPEIFFLNAEEERMIRRQVSEVNREFPEVVFNLPRQRFNNSIEYNNQFEEFKKGERKWDLFIVDIYRLQECIENDLIYPLDELVSKEFRDQYLPVALDQCTVDGRLWAIPHWINVGVLAYRRDLLSRYQLPPPRTWEDLVDYSRYILHQESDDRLKGFGFPGAQFEALTCNFLEFLWNNGGGIYDPSLHITINNDQGVQALEYMIDLIHRSRVCPANTPDLTEAQITRLFLDDHLVFMRSWPDLLSRPLSTPGPAHEQVGLAPLPTASTGISPQGVIGGFCYVIPRYVPDPEVLVQFYQKFYSPPTIVDFALKGWTCPPFRSVYENPDVLRKRPFYENLPDLFQSGGSRTKVLYYNHLTRLVRREVNLALRQNKSAREAMDTVANDLGKTIHRTLHERRLVKVLDHIRRNLHRDLKRDEVATQCHLSPSYFSSLFKDVFGCTFTQYLVQRRIEQAKYLLTSSEQTIAEIAQEVGFSDQSYFCRVFRTITHMTPTQYRMDGLSKVGHH